MWVCWAVENKKLTQHHQHTTEDDAQPLDLQIVSWPTLVMRGLHIGKEDQAV